MCCCAPVNWSCRSRKRSASNAASWVRAAATPHLKTDITLGIRVIVFSTEWDHSRLAAAAAAGARHPVPPAARGGRDAAPGTKSSWFQEQEWCHSRLAVGAGAAVPHRAPPAACGRRRRAPVAPHGGPAAAAAPPPGRTAGAPPPPALPRAAACSAINQEGLRVWFQEGRRV